MVMPNVDSAQLVRAFSYEPLLEPDAIRLIILQPAVHDSDELQCSLIHTSLSQCEDDIFDHYTALSYVWGDGIDRRTISLDDSPFSITANLYLALRDLRHATKILRLWADAICINQDDEDEKGLQVARMGKIYATAHHTVIYLGSVDPRADTLLPQVIPAISSMSIARKLPWSIRRDFADLILSKAWFRRVWVLQELVFSLDPRIQLGKYRWRWDYMYTFLKEFQEPASLDSAEASSYGESKAHPRFWFYTEDTALQGYELLLEMQLARDKHQGKVTESNQATLFRLIVGRRGLGVTDQRDMIFAHIGFASDGYDRFLKPDYSKTCEEVYEDYARSVIDNYGSPSILFHVGDPRSTSRPPRLASWAPDWSSTKSTSPLIELIQEIGLASSGETISAGSEAGKKFHYNYTWIKNPSVLACLGREVDRIARSSVKLSEQDIPIAKRTEFTARCKVIVGSWMPWLSSPAAVNGMYQNTRDRMLGEIVSLYCDIYNTWREIIQDDQMLPDWRIISREPNFRMLYPPWQSEICLKIVGIKDHDDQPHSPGLPVTARCAESKSRVHLTVIDCLIWSVFTGFERLIKDRRLAQTATGCLSLVPSYAEPDDLIFSIDHLLAETNILCLIRPKPDLHNSTLDETIRLKLDLARLSQPKDGNTYENHNSKPGKLEIVHGTFVGDCFFDLHKERMSRLMQTMHETPRFERPMVYAIH